MVDIESDLMRPDREPWFAGNFNGRSHRLRFPDTQPLFQLRAPQRAEPLLWCVQSNANWARTENVPDQRVLVDLNWGNIRTGQGGLSATIDAGQSVVICSEFLQGEVRCPGAEVVPPLGTSLDPYVDFRVMVSRGNRSNSKPVTFTDERRSTDETGYAGPWTVPPWADEVRLLFDFDWTTAVQDATVFFGTVPAVIVGGTITSVQRSAGGGTQPSRVDVSRDARYMVVRMSGACNVQPVWVLQI